MNPKLLTRLAATSLPASLHPSLQIAGSWPASITDRRQSVVEMPQPTAMDYYAEYRLALILDIQIRPRVSVAAPRPTYPCSSLMSIVDLKIIDAGGLDIPQLTIIGLGVFIRWAGWDMVQGNVSLLLNFGSLLLPKTY